MDINEIRQSAFDETNRQQMYAAYKRYQWSEQNKETDLNHSEWAEINLFFTDSYRALDLYLKGFTH